MTDYTININNQTAVVTADPDTPLLYVLRQAGYYSVRYGCGLEQCGCCKVLVNSQPVYACTRKISDVGDADIVTLEGHTEITELQLLRQAFLDENAGQCGFCLSGIIMTALELLTHNPQPTREDIQKSLANNLCRCGAHNRIIRAIQRAARSMSHLNE